MKHFSIFLTASGLFFLASCGGSSTTDSGSAENTALVSETPKAPVIVIDGAGWAATDLSAISNFIPIIINLPKDAKMEKNGNGGVDVYLNKAYTITVSTTTDGTVKEAMESDKSLNVNNTTSYTNGKMIVDEPNGFVYSMQMKDEENGTKYEPEAHFFCYMEKDGAVYSIMDVRPMDNGFLPGSVYTEDNAKKLYDIVKSSAKLK